MLLRVHYDLLDIGPFKGRMQITQIQNGVLGPPRIDFASQIVFQWNSGLFLCLLWLFLCSDALLNLKIMIFEGVKLSSQISECKPFCSSVITTHFQCWLCTPNLIFDGTWHISINPVRSQRLMNFSCSFPFDFERSSHRKHSSPWSSALFWRMLVFLLPKTRHVCSISALWSDCERECVPGWT